jgi:glycosyltransferase involved in cell wall biosynthesis
MRGLLTNYRSAARRETLVPWAIDEPELPLPPDPEHRELIFGKARLALLYSGNFGLAHSYQEILDLAESLPRGEIKVAFSVGGNRKAELQEVVKLRNLDAPFVPFARTSELRARLACADVHIVTLREEWTGMVVPSKFFGALSAGRPVLFAGCSESSLAQWIREFGIGWTLNSQNIQEVKDALIRYAQSPDLRAEMQIQCFSVYRQHFSRATQLDKWNEILRELLR